MVHRRKRGIALKQRCVTNSQFVQWETNEMRTGVHISALTATIWQAEPGQYALT